VFDKQMNGIGPPTEIVRAYDEGESWCSGVETSTHTYLCEGHGAHNSVSEHSVRGCELFPVIGSLDERRAFLLHDAAETYLGDLASPLKRLRVFGFYRRAERKWLRCIGERFGVDPELLWSPAIKHVDRRMLATEQRDLMATPRRQWSDMPEPLPDRITETWLPERAEREFLRTFVELFGDTEEST